MKKPKAFHIKKAAKPKKIKPIKVKGFKASKMPKSHKVPAVKPFKPTLKEEPQTVKGILSQLSADMPPAVTGVEDAKIRGGRMATVGARYHKKTAKTQEQLDKEVKAYGPKG